MFRIASSVKEERGYIQNWTRYYLSDFYSYRTNGADIALREIIIRASILHSMYNIGYILACEQQWDRDQHNDHWHLNCAAISEVWVRCPKATPDGEKHQRSKSINLVKFYYLWKSSSIASQVWRQLDAKQLQYKMLTNKKSKVQFNVLPQSVVSGLHWILNIKEVSSAVIIMS